MGKTLIILFVIFLAIESLSGYFFLSRKIADGERRIADGQRQLEAGRPEFDDGKARMEAGKRESSEGRRVYEHAENNLFLVLADKLFNSGKGFKDARDRIAEGDRQVAKGEDEVNIGKMRIDAGELELRLGREELILVKKARAACVIGAFFFTTLSILLGFLWKRSLARIFMHKTAGFQTSS